MVQVNNRHGDSASNLIFRTCARHWITLSHLFEVIQLLEVLIILSNAYNLFYC